MYNQQDLVVTSIDDLVKASQGTLVELPPFIEGVPFVARLKRPSMLALVRAGKIPNALIGTANTLFADGKVNTRDDNALDNLFGVLDAICDACFVEPTYKQLQDAGITLSDDQLMFVFNYTQRGVNALNSFRSQLKSVGDTKDVSDVSQNSSGTVGH